MFKRYRNQEFDMTFWWKKHPKEPTEYAKYITEQLHNLLVSDSIETKKFVNQEIKKYLIIMKSIMLHEVEPKISDEIETKFYNEIINCDLFLKLIRHLPDLEFETRKDIIFLYSLSLRYFNETNSSQTQHFFINPVMISTMLRSTELVIVGNSSRDIFLTLTNMIIESSKYERMCELLLNDEFIWRIFEYCNLPDFEISTEALHIITTVFSIHSEVVSEFFLKGNKTSTCHELTGVNNNATRFIRNVNNLLVNGSYVCKRQITKLLGSLLILRANNKLMMVYINNPENLRLIMTLLGNKSKSLQFEAFNIFKIIVANPEKPLTILQILANNREKLLAHLPKIGMENKDSTFSDEIDYIMQEINSF
ncbi:hypothetical protein TPHA_0B01960 [Tetrapisispora phaffii CBS 4417]|uniref:Uncharacterized protein n=1 Tax=Tetrapisispora phaffii (strain ATCC 24235 / CBS 4417 / NBRC 1672 / NRRL Y-8282 / UCD 70-5) TaxID=1071381 RepID=G8BPD7_TETPH|nr:hypothetical protein TPHA_0B01960 [Tetrapisispora phaffii CBS 4417]CCE61868.1 hypothetical protein TPHA_0B01960 [Tetrapisispora phaffii CBS 4417]